MKTIKCILILACLFLFGCLEPNRKENDSRKDYIDDTITISKVSVYIENSASMDGYVNGTTSFKYSLFQFIDKINDGYVCDTIELNYINNSIINCNEELRYYIKNMTPETFKERGGNRSTTDIAEVIRKISLDKGGDEVAMLVSDIIISPGNGDAEQYLIDQQTNITSILSDVVKGQNVGVVVYKLISEFNGNYYNPLDQPSTYHGYRPYYVILVGKENHLAKLINKEYCYKVENLDNSEFKEKCVFVNNVVLKDYKINKGQCVYNLQPESHELSLRKDVKGNIVFDVYVKFQTILDEQYITNKTNYTLSDSSYTIVSIAKSDIENYSHKVRFKASRIHPCNLIVKLEKKFPYWIKESNDSIGGNLSNANAMQTYGILYILTGVSEAFSNEEYVSFEIKIK